MVGATGEGFAFLGVELGRALRDPAFDGEIRDQLSGHEGSFRAPVCPVLGSSRGQP